MNTIEQAQIRAVVVYPPGEGYIPAWPTSIAVREDGTWFGVVAWEKIATLDERIVQRFVLPVANGDEVPLLRAASADRAAEMTGRVTSLLRVGASIIVGRGTSENLRPGIYGVGVDADG